MKPIRIGLVGAGCIARDSHLPAYKKAQGVELAAICDLDLEKAKKAAAAFGVPYYDSMEQMIAAENLDAVDICTWNSAHVPLSIQAAKAGLHVMCEKPAAASLKEMAELKKTLEENGTVYLLAVPNRFKSESLCLRELYDQGEFGEVYYAKTSYLRRRGEPLGWFSDKKYSGGGPVMDLAVHALDGAWYLMGAPKPVRISAKTFKKIHAPLPKGINPYTATQTPENPHDCEESGSGVIYFENGAQLFFEASWTVNLPNRREVFISGSKGGAQHNPPTIYKDKNGYLAEEVLEIKAKADPFQGELEHLADCIRRGDRNTRYNIDQAMMMQQMLEGIYRSAESGKEIMIEELL